MKKKLSIFVLALALLFTMIPVTVGADEAVPTILWDFNEDNNMDELMSGANTLVYLGDTDGDNSYYEFMAGGSDPYVTMNTPADDVSEIVWVKIRLKNESTATAVELFGATNFRGLTGPECTHIDIIPESDQWYTYIIYIPDENVRTANAYKGATLDETYWQGSVQSIRLDPMWKPLEDGTDDGTDNGGNMESGDSILIDYVAFFPTKDEALTFRTDLDNYAFPEQGEGGDTRVMEVAAPVERAEGEPAILWNFGTDEEMSKIMSGASSVEYASGTDGTTEYYEFTATGGDPNVTISSSASDVSEIIWAKARIRNVSGAATAVELFGSTNGRGLSGPECTHIDITQNTDEWQTVIINIPDANVATANQYKGAELTSTYWEGFVSSIRLDPMWRPAEDGTDAGGSMSEGDRIQIDYIAFFPTKEEAEAYEPAAVQPAAEETTAPETAAPETTAPETVETPAPAEETVSAPAQSEAPQTFDFAVIAAIVTLISMGGVVISKKKR